MNGQIGKGEVAQVKTTKLAWVKAQLTVDKIFLFLLLLLLWGLFIVPFVLFYVSPLDIEEVSVLVNCTYKAAVQAKN